MNVSSVVTGALESSNTGGASVQQAAALAAFRSALQSQAALLQLFDPATAVPPPSSGRGQNLNISV
jgi:hypothetical protein